MKRFIFIFAAAVMIFFLVSCSKSPTESISSDAVVTKSAQEYIGQQYSTVVSELRDSGFQNIVENELDDVTEDNSSDIGVIQSITIAGSSDFSAETVYPSDAEVVLTYHSAKKISVPMSAAELQGIEYQEVATILAEAGFTNINTSVVVDQDPDELNAEFLNEIDIAYSTHFEAGYEFAYNAPIHIICHLPYNKYDVAIHIDFVTNLLFSKYDVDYSFGDIDNGTLEHGVDKDLVLRAKEGIYTLAFSERGASSNCTEIEIDVQDDMVAAFKLLCANDKITVETIYVELEHAAGDGQAAAPDSSGNLKYKNYEDVEAQLRNAGFTDISTEAQYDIIWGWTDEGEVAEVSIDGITDFTRGDIFSADAQVIIIYHMKYEDDPSERTYEGIAYDRAYYCADKDGLRARAYWYYLFNETEGLALYISHSTAGSGMTAKLYGTYSGSFDSKIVITFETSNGPVEHLLYKEDGVMYAQKYENDKKAFSAKDVKSSIVDFRNW